MSPYSGMSGTVRERAPRTTATEPPGCEPAAVGDREAPEQDRFFREIVLCLGGIFAVHGCDDVLVRQVARSLEQLYERARARRVQPPHAPRRAPPSPHPAIEALLFRIGRR